MRHLIILILISRVYTEIQVKHSMYVSRKSRSYTSPSEKTYHYNDYNIEHEKKPKSRLLSSESHRSIGVGTNYKDQNGYSPSYEYIHAPAESYNEHVSGNTYTTVPPPPIPPPVTGYHEEPTTKYDIDFEKMKSEARYNARYLPSKIISDLMYERLKSLMHYKPYSDQNINEIEFDFSNKYHSDDDDDIRTVSRTSNDLFPYFYHGPYEHEYDANIDTVKDKRYTPDNYHNVIPVHEHISDDIAPKYNYDKPSKYPRRTYIATTEKSPVAGDVGFFSYVLNDYYDKADEEDPLTFNGINEWGNDVHYDSDYYDGDIQRRSRQKDKKNFRFHNPSPTFYSKHAPVNHGEHAAEIYRNNNNNIFSTTPSYISKDSLAAYGESVTERGHINESEFDNGTKSHDLKSKEKIGYDKHKVGYKSFKDIADSLAHKFGVENHNRDTRHDLKHNQDKGENRRGFHRVYHKDEYMEDKEFFDNSNSSTRGHDKGNSSIRNGGSEAILKSNAIAHVGDESNATRLVGDRGNKHSESSHHGHSSSNDSDGVMNRYRDIAKKTAQSNNDNDYHHNNVKYIDI